jgi:hypothetical protein
MLTSLKGQDGRYEMTICISVRTPEGLVLAADSMVSLEGTVDTPQGRQRGVFQTFEFANKVSQFKDYTIGIMSWGIASISNRSIQSLIMEFEYGYASLQDNADFAVKQVADDLLVEFRRLYDAAYPSGSEQPLLGLYIGGYSARQFFSNQYQYEFPRSNDWEIIRPNKPDGSPDFGANWFGQAEPLRRLIKGYDIRSINELVRRGADQAIVQGWIDSNVSELPLIFDGMPIQDAVDFANYAVQVTIGCFRFAGGPPLCGGNIDIAVITPAAFHWAQRKQWSIKE